MSFTIANAKKNTLSQVVKTNNYTGDDYHLDITATNDSHAILARGALGAKTILDVGCGVGYIGGKLKELQKCTVDGIDADEEALAIAGKIYDHTTMMLLGDKTDKNFCSFLNSKKKYDVIICGDIIEHLPDPGYIISILAKKLSKTGKLLISIPNISHIDVIAGLIDGKFNYGETGILDNTHLRFWTENSFYDFVSNINGRYGLNLHPKLIAKTYVQNAEIDDEFFQSLYGKDIHTFQNIFQLEVKSKNYVPKTVSRKNYQKLVQANIHLKELESEVERLHQEIANRDKIITDLRSNVHDMETSASWKITAPLRKINAKFHK